MTANELYFDSLLKDDCLPAVVPVEDDEGSGIATVVFGVRESTAASHFVFSPNPTDRARAALFACKSTREAVDAGLGDQLRHT